ncbi:MAG: hypothetical protein ACTHLW_19585, partial [Verrucomicrobiota bacterium]
DVQRQADTIQLTWNSQTGRVYAVEYSADLKNWAEFPTNVAATAGTGSKVSLSTTDPLVGNEFVLLQYKMGQFGPQVQDAAKTAAGGNLTPGSGLNYFNADFGGYSSSPALIANFVAVTPNVATALSNNSVFTFDLTVGSNVTDLDLSQVTFNAARGNTSTPRGYAVYVTTPTTTNQLIQPATDIGSYRFVWSAQQIDLTGISSLQNLRAGQVVRFRIPIYAPDTINSIELDDLTIRGAVSPRPVPAYVGAGQLYVRVRELPSPPILVEAATSPGGSWNWYSTRTLDQLPSYLSGTVDGGTSIYGGLLSSQTNATGFFHPLKIDGRWWLIDPLGYRFLHQGVAVVSTINSTGAVAALTAKFTNSSNWAVATTALLRSNKFNGARAWSDTSRIRQVPGPLVYTIIKDFLASYGNPNNNPGYPQVFDPEFASYCQSYAQSFANTANDPYLLGYFSDNELSFSSSILVTWLGLAAGNSSYDEAWRWLRERYGPGATVGQVTTQDRYDFLGHVWGKYYSVVNQAIKLRDPNHLYLGSRLFSSDKDRPEIFREAGPYVDVISVNHYSQWTPDISRIRMWEQESGRPVIITEFYVKGEDSGMPNNTGAGWVVHTQKDRGRFYQNFVLALLESKVCVGWHWFKYADNDPDSNPDPSNIDSNKGIVSNRYEPYPDLLEEMLRINERIYRLADYFDGSFAP